MLAEATRTIHEGRSMASTFQVICSRTSETQSHDAAIRDAVQAIESVAATCSRFDPMSDLVTLNSSNGLTKVTMTLLDVLAEALDAHHRTDGRFDPRVIEDLERLGYDRSFAEGISPMKFPESRSPLSDLRIDVDFEAGTADLHGDRIDLGGIAKGFAVDRAADALDWHGVSGLVDLGGDGRVTGPEAQGTPWMIGVEDPFGGVEPLAVFSLDRGAYATSSTKVRTWDAGGKRVHHLIDSRTGLPGGEGLMALSVISETTTRAEVDAKVAFLMGRDEVRSHVERKGIAAMWVDDKGSVECSEQFEKHLVWRRP